jgi:hypothetical protein
MRRDAKAYCRLDCPCLLIPSQLHCHVCRSRDMCRHHYGHVTLDMTIDGLMRESEMRVES